MLTRCHLNRAIIRHNARCISQLHRLQAAPALRHIPHGFGGDRPSIAGTRREFLEPVPHVRNALFQDQHPMPWIHLHLNDKADARRPEMYSFDNLQLAGIQTLEDYNTLVSRIRKLGGPIYPETLLSGIKFAIKNPAAMKEYLVLWKNSTYYHHPSLRLARQETFNYVKHKLTEPSHSTKGNKRLALQYLEVITGWTHGGCRTRPDEIRQPSLYNLVKGRNLDRWCSYMQILVRFGGGKALYEAWKDYSDLFQGNNGQRNTSTPATTNQGARISTSRPSDARVLRIARNVTIRMLIIVGDWKLAWWMTYGVEDVTEEIQPATWKYLLRFPQGLRKWIPQMNDPAIAMLESEAGHLERKLGIRWVGGEDGYHVVEYGPFQDP